MQATHGRPPVFASRRVRARRSGLDNPVMRVVATAQATVRWVLRRFDPRGHRVVPSERGRLTQRLCGELAAHLDIEEQLLYPRLRGLVSDPKAIERSFAEHKRLRRSIRQLMEMDPDSPPFAAHVRVLDELFRQHLERELQQVYPSLRSLPVDLDAMAREMAERHDRLLARWDAHCQGHAARG